MVLNNPPPTVLRFGVFEVDLRAELMPVRQRLITALHDHPEGGLTREALIKAGLTAEDAISARRL